MADVAPLLAEHGYAWAKAAITGGQYRHPDGLHYGGAATAQSLRILEQVVAERLTSAERVFIIDLHTGHGPSGHLTVLTDEPEGSPEDQVLRACFETAVSSAGDNDSSGGPKSGPIARGIANLLTGAETVVATFEIGTADDLEQLEATYGEQWVHRRSDPADPTHRLIRQRYSAGSGWAGP